LWWRGDWRAMLSAIGFAALFNLALVCTFVWPNYAPTWVIVTGWIVIILYWTWSAWHAFRCLSAFEVAGGRPLVDQLFERAQKEYLARDWFEAESLLKRILREKKDDVDARLMLATLYRRTERSAEADQCLCRLERMDGAEKWALEMGRERNLLASPGSNNEAA
jgi:hypothetical protein